jgi:nucleotidyltransferase/DNA polymerase involved in DNA repair
MDGNGFIRRHVVDQLACINVAALPLQILLRIHPAWTHLPVVVAEEDRPHAIVLYVNAQARRAGIRSGLRYATAQALAGQLHAGTVSQSQMEDTVHALVARLQRHSPHVEPASGMPGVFWVDVQGLDRLYSSLRTWADAVRTELRSMSMKATVVVGFSRFGVYALAMAHQGILVCEDAAQEQASVQKVPLHRLNFDPKIRDRLRMLRVATVGDFLHLPGEGIRIGFGAETDEMYQLVMGNRWTPLRPAAVEKVYARSIEFEEPESNTERLVFVIKRLLDGLIMALSGQSKAVEDVCLEMRLQDRAARTAQRRRSGCLGLSRLISQHARSSARGASPIFSRPRLAGCANRARASFGIARSLCGPRHLPPAPPDRVEYDFHDARRRNWLRESGDLGPGISVLFDRCADRLLARRDWNSGIAERRRPCHCTTLVGSAGNPSF